MGRFMHFTSGPSKIQPHPPQLLYPRTPDMNSSPIAKLQGQSGACGLLFPHYGTTCHLDREHCILSLPWVGKLPWALRLTPHHHSTPPATSCKTTLWPVLPGLWKGQSFRLKHPSCPSLCLAKYLLFRGQSLLGEAFPEHQLWFRFLFLCVPKYPAVSRWDEMTTEAHMVSLALVKYPGLDLVSHT